MHNKATALALEEFAMRAFALLAAMSLLTFGCGVPDESVVLTISRAQTDVPITERGSTDDYPAPYVEPLNPIEDKNDVPKIESPNNDNPQPPTKTDPTFLELAQNFELPEPDFTNTIEMDLWATYYYLPQVSASNDGYPLLGTKGEALGPKLSQRDWCNAAMEGSVRVNFNGKNTTYNFASSQANKQVDCSAYFSHNVGGTRFKIAKGEFGDGVKNYKLVPFRSIAVDKSVIPYGSLVYIHAARGTKITLPDGRTVAHDGYFFAADTGGAIKQTHIDVFIGVAKKNPFSWIKSSTNGTFDGLLIEKNDLTDALSELHTEKKTETRL
jgi:3D (Asp-Asp-Asp) domain-containing protein